MSAPSGQSGGTRRPIDPVLDVVVYAPVGLALTVGEELPKLAAKGRSQLTSQIAMARLIGQFAVAQGRRQAQRWLSGPAKGTPEGAAPEPTDPAPPPSDDAATGTADEVASGPATTPVATGPVATGPSQASSQPAGAPGSADGRSSSDGLGIPGYDSLSASQVVQRLSGLDRAELDAVGAYERAHRGRRTILARVEQLQAHSD